MVNMVPARKMMTPMNSSAVVASFTPISGSQSSALPCDSVCASVTTR